MRLLIVSLALLGAVASVQPAAAQMQEKKAFCLVSGGSAPGGAKEECRYDTMAQCEESRKGNVGARCLKNDKM